MIGARLHNRGLNSKQLATDNKSGTGSIHIQKNAYKKYKYKNTKIQIQISPELDRNRNITDWRRLDLGLFLALAHVLLPIDV